MSCKDSIQFSISQVISITNSGSTCSESVCCASSTFNADTQFQLLETGVFTYGIVVLSSILGFVDATDFGVLSYTLNAAELMNSMITIDPFGATSNTLRIVKFIIIGEGDIIFNYAFKCTNPPQPLMTLQLPTPHQLLLTPQILTPQLLTPLLRLALKAALSRWS